MMTQRSKRHREPRISPAFCLLAAGCVGLILSVSFAYAHVSAAAAARPQWEARPSTASAEAWDSQQQAVVEVEVDVRSEDDVALLRSMGYACGVGLCELELPAGEEQTLTERGLPVRVVARAIKVSGSARAALATRYEYGYNYNDVIIPDANSGCGAAAYSDIVISTAPAGATVAFISPSLRVAHPRVGDLKVWLQNGQHVLTLWNRHGGYTDENNDHDIANDADIELGYADWEVHTFDGDPVNQRWRLYAQDCEDLLAGNIDRWTIHVYYDCTHLTPHVPSGPSPADGATNQSRDVDLNWADAGHATSYDVYFDILTPPSKVGTTASSSYALGTLFPGGSYKWQIVAKNACGETRGPLWVFQTCRVPNESHVVAPADGATNQSLDVDLDWDDAYDATSYDIYFGTSASPPKVGTSTSSSYALGTLACATQYYWKIVAKNSCGEESGPVWDFTTTCCMPATPAGPSPSHGATNLSIYVDLNWADAAGATSYDIYFGAAAPPPYVGNTAASSYALPTLSYNTRYYWKIVARMSCGDAAGPVWYFNTQPAVSAQTIHLPILLRR